MSDSKKIWDDHYKENEALRHHRFQNESITSDFLIHASCRPVREIMDALQKSNSIIELGCGTGEMSAIFSHSFPNATTIVATEQSEDVLLAAKVYGNQFPNIRYEVCDIVKNSLPHAGFDLAVMSNVLEHFEDWATIVDKLVSSYKNVLLIVPYKERLDATPSQRGVEGGMGHCTSFSEDSFKGYKVIKDMVFFSLQGWGVSWAGECPLQYAVLLSGNQA